MGVDFSQLVWHEVGTAFGFWRAAGAYTTGFVLLWAVLHAAIRSFSGGANIGNARPGTWALKVCIFLHHATVGPLALLALLQDPAVRAAIGGLGLDKSAALLTRDPAGPSVAAAALIPVTIGYMAADLILMSQWDLIKSGKVENSLMVLHHILSMCSWPVTVYYNYCGRYMLFLLSYELSSVFMVINWFLSQKGLKNSKAYIVSGLCFTFAFVMIRLVGAVPQIFAMVTAPPVRQPLPDVPAWALWNGFIWMILPHILNAFWGVKVVKGVMAVLKGTETKNEKKQKDTKAS